jgi:hypothetical protein
MQVAPTAGSPAVEAPGAGHTRQLRWTGPPWCTLRTWNQTRSTRRWGYIFEREVLEKPSRGQADFGKHVIPRIIATHRVHAFQYQGYWEDIGTIRSFYEANLDLCEPLPKFNFYDATAPIFTHARYLPGTKIIAAGSIAPSFRWLRHQ